MEITCARNTAKKILSALLPEVDARTIVSLAPSAKSSDRCPRASFRYGHALFFDPQRTHVIRNCELRYRAFYFPARRTTGDQTHRHYTKLLLVWTFRLKFYSSLCDIEYAIFTQWGRSISYKLLSSLDLRTTSNISFDSC